MLKKVLCYPKKICYAIITKILNEEGDIMPRVDMKLEREANNILLDNNMLKVPVDLIEIANNNGIEVYYEKLPNDISGAIRYNDNKKRFQILIEETEPSYRQRFTLAHELAHYFLEGKKLLCNQEIHFDTRYRKDRNQSECRADYFASALLMDKDSLEKLYGICQSVPALARTFDVSESAMKRRLIKLGLLFEKE